MVSCDLADLRPTPQGIEVDGIEGSYTIDLPSRVVPRAEVVDELYAALVHGHALIHSGEWARATLEASLAILEASKTQTRVNAFEYQVSPSRGPSLESRGKTL